MKVSNKLKFFRFFNDRKIYANNYFTFIIWIKLINISNDLKDHNEKWHKYWHGHQIFEQYKCINLYLKRKTE